MKISPEDFTGKVFGRLTVTSARERKKIYPSGKTYREIVCICSCLCGNTKQVLSGNLQRGLTNSCGCLHKEAISRINIQHGLSGTRTYSIWQGLVSRCTKEGDSAYENYGGRGIPVYNPWLECDGKGFVNFLSDMGEVPSANHSIERKNVNSGYSPENCIWTDDLGLQGYNTTIRADNTTGKTGVSSVLRKSGAVRWIAEIYKDKIHYRKGFNSFEEASHQRDVWEIEFYGFNHCNIKNSCNVTMDGINNE